jgi:hypothetical protein
MVRRFNSGDADRLAELYHEGAVNHQVVQEPIAGKVAIRAMFRREFAAADMTCIPEVIHEAGDVAILEWMDPLGLRGCGFFTVKGDRIVFQPGEWVERLRNPSPCCAALRPLTNISRVIRDI